MFAGGILGAKYTGCIVAAGLAVAITIEYRSIISTSAFCVGSLFTGIWPYLRNFSWTGDPVFPFLTKRLIPEKVNSFALDAISAYTGASHSSHLGQLIPFTLFAGMRHVSPGFWDFFGPFVFALAPLLLFNLSDLHKWRVPIVVWCCSAYWGIPCIRPAASTSSCLPSCTYLYRCGCSLFSTKGLADNRLFGHMFDNCAMDIGGGWLADV